MERWSTSAAALGELDGNGFDQHLIFPDFGLRIETQSGAYTSGKSSCVPVWVPGAFAVNACHDKGAS